LKRDTIHLRDLRVSDAILYLLLASGIVGRPISDAQLYKAVQELYRHASELLKYRLRGYGNSGAVSCVDRVKSRWTIDGLMLTCVAEAETGLVVSPSRNGEFMSRFCDHARTHLEQYVKPFRVALLDEGLPESNPGGIEMVPFEDEVAAKKRGKNRRLFP